MKKARVLAKKSFPSQFLAVLILSATLYGFLASNSLPLASAASEENSTKPLFFYLHNTTSSLYVNGYETFYIMNTTRQWSASPAIVKNLHKLEHYWYLYPTLASNYTINGKISLGIWINATGTTPSGTPTLTIYERFPNATEVLVYSETFGSMDLYNAPSYLNLTANSPVAYTFKKGSSIRLYFSIVVGAATYAQLWFDNEAFDSRLVMESMDYMQVSSVKTYDVYNNETTVFSALWNATERKVVIRVNLTDPFGGYDIYQVNATLIDPAQQAIFENQTMHKISGDLFSYSNVYEVEWTYAPDVVLGNYTIIVSAVDNSGYSYYCGASGVYGSYGQYLEFGYGSFFIGTPYFVQIKTVDAHEKILESAHVYALSKEVIVDHGYTNASGWWTATLYSGFYNITVYWQDTLVARESIEVTAEANFTIICSVYDPSFRFVDDVNNPLPKTPIYIQSPNGTVSILPMYTNEGGFLNLTQTPLGDYRLTVWWKGVIVQEKVETVDSDGPYVVKCKVYQLTVNVLGNDGSTVHGAYVWVYTDAGVPYDFKMTDAIGRAVFRLPIGTYRIEAYYSTAYMLTHVVANATEPTVPVNSSRSIDITFQDYPPPIWTTIAFWLILTVVLAIVLATVIYLLYRRREHPNPKSKKPSSRRR